MTKTVGLRIDPAQDTTTSASTGASTSGSSTSATSSSSAMTPKKDRKNPSALDAVIEVK